MVALKKVIIKYYININLQMLIFFRQAFCVKKGIEKRFKNMLPAVYSNYIYPITSGKVKEFLQESTKAKTKRKAEFQDEQLATESWSQKHHSNNDCLIMDNRKHHKAGHFQAKTIINLGKSKQSKAKAMPSNSKTDLHYYCRFLFHFENQFYDQKTTSLDLSDKAVQELTSGQWLTDVVIEAYVLCASPRDSLFLFPSEIISSILNDGLTNTLTKVNFNYLLNLKNKKNIILIHLIEIVKRFQTSSWCRLYQ